MEKKGPKAGISIQKGFRRKRSRGISSFTERSLVMVDEPNPCGTRKKRTCATRGLRSMIEGGMCEGNEKGNVWSFVFATSAQGGDEKMYARIPERRGWVNVSRSGSESSRAETHGVREIYASGVWGQSSLDGVWTRNRSTKLAHEKREKEVIGQTLGRLNLKGKS